MASQHINAPTDADESEATTYDVRRELKRARTILIKIGTEIVHSTDGVLAMGQIGAIVEQVRFVCALYPAVQ